jgi:hypothetical protein
MSKGMAAASLGLVAYGAGRTAFMPVAPGSVLGDPGVALRGAVAGEQVAAGEGATVTQGMLCVSGAAMVVAALGHTGNHRGRSVARKAVEEVVVANAVDDAVEAEPEAPPPPPPFNPANEVGVTAPLGFSYPLGFSKVGDKEGFRALRLAEIKHARVAMMAAVGAVFQCLVHLPGFEKVPDGIGAVTSGGNGTIGFAALFVISGVLELVFWKQDPNKQVGDFGNPLQPGAPLGYNTDMRNFELNNGRFSMFAAIGIIAAEVVSGKTAVTQLGF